MNGPGYKLSYSSQVINSTGGKVAWAESPEGSSIQTDDFIAYTSHCANWGYHFNPENNKFFDFADADINFVDAATGDFNIVDGSSAIGAGTVLDGFTSSDTPDCGALEAGNRVLNAGAALSSPDFKEEGTNFIPETEWIEYVDFPVEFIDTTTIFTFTVAYNAFEQRDIIVSFHAPDNSFIAQGRTTVDAGRDTTTVIVSADAQPAAPDYIFLAAIRPLGGAYGSDISSQTAYSDIIELADTALYYSDSKALNLVVYPNPAQGILHIQAEQNGSADLHVEIHSTLGAMLYSEEIKAGAGKAEINISDLPAGTYILKIDGHRSSIFTKTYSDR